MLRGVSYTVRSGGPLYLALTNSCNSATLIATRGPGFSMPDGFEPLPDGGEEPSAAQLAAVVVRAYEDIEIIGMGENDGGITFAGLGEPLLRLETLLETVRLVKESNHGVPFRVVTNGLVGPEVAEALKGGGVKQVTVALAAHTPPLYEKLMAPQDGRGFGDVCAFVDACAQAGLLVECTAVEAPGVNKDATRKLAMSLGAAEFRVRSYHA